MFGFQLLPLLPRRSSAVSAAKVLLSSSGRLGGRSPSWRRPGFYRVVRSWLRAQRRSRHVRVVPHESAIVRERRYFVTHWTRFWN